MLTLERLHICTSVETWINSSSNVIKDALIAQLEYIRSHSFLNLQDYNQDILALSEMMLCGGIEKILLPSGYKSTSGLVYGAGDYPLPHTYAISGTDILCITPGQFITGVKYPVFQEHFLRFLP